MRPPVEVSAFIGDLTSQRKAVPMQRLSPRCPGERLRSLGARFVELSRHLRALDVVGDDADRVEAAAVWLEVAREIAGIPANDRAGLLVKARVMLALVDAEGASGPFADAARSLAADIERASADLP